MVEDIDVHLCTHMIYAFAVLDRRELTMKIFDNQLDINLNNYQKFVDMKNRNPKLKVLIALGGWTDSTEKPTSYAKLFQSSSNRAKFIK